MSSSDPQNPTTLRCECCGQTSFNRKWPGFRICLSCGMMTVDEVYNPTELRNLYGPAYFSGDEYQDYLGDAEIHRRTLSHHAKALRKYVPAGSTILEVGCAYGLFLDEIAADYPQNMGIDICEDVITHAATRGHQVSTKDISQFSDNSFDAVCLWDTLEHLPQPASMIRHCSRILKSGGYLLLTTGDFGSMVAKLRGLKWRQIHPPTHLHYFTRKSLRLLSDNSDLHVVRFGTQPNSHRVRSVLKTISRKNGPLSSLSKMALRLSPQWLQNTAITINLLDTLIMVARKNSPDQLSHPTAVGHQG